MFALALLILAAPTAHQPQASHPKIHHPVAHRRVHRRKIMASRPVRLLLTSAEIKCAGSTCRHDAGSRYRLLPEAEAQPTTMQRAMEGTPPSCGIIGASVCPTRRRPILRAAITAD